MGGSLIRYPPPPVEGASVGLMWAIQAPPATALIKPARRDSPRPAATVRSASGPRPKTSRLPSGIPTTSPDGVLTRAATEQGDRFSIAFLPVGERCAGSRFRGECAVLPGLGAGPAAERIS